MWLEHSHGVVKRTLLLTRLCFDSTKKILFWRSLSPLRTSRKIKIEINFLSDFHSELQKIVFEQRDAVVAEFTIIASNYT